MSQTLFKNRLGKFVNNANVGSGGTTDALAEYGNVTSGSSLDEILCTYTISANTITANGQGFKIYGSINYAANANSKEWQLMVTQPGGFYFVFPVDLNNKNVNFAAYVLRYSGTTFFISLDELTYDTTSGVLLPTDVYGGGNVIFPASLNITSAITVSMVCQTADAPNDLVKSSMIIEII